MNTPARILLVEDDRILRKAGEVTLSKRGYVVVVAGDGEEARAYLVKSSLRPEQLAEKVAETLGRPG